MKKIIIMKKVVAYRLKKELYSNIPDNMLKEISLLPALHLLEKLSKALQLPSSAQLKIC